MQSLGSTTIRVLRICSLYQSPGDRSAGCNPDIATSDSAQLVHIREISRRLDERGFKQIVVSAPSPNNRKWERVGTGAEVFRPGLSVPWVPFFVLSGARCAARVARRADLVHAHIGRDVSGLAIAFEAARRHSLPWIVTIHEAERRTSWFGDIAAEARNTLEGSVRTALLRRADAVIREPETPLSPWESITDRLESLYRSILANSAVGGRLFNSV